MPFEAWFPHLSNGIITFSFSKRDCDDYVSESLKSAQNFAWYVADALPVSCCHCSYYYYYVIIIITTTALVSFILSLSSLSQHIPAFLNKCLTNL